jgi:hypothetical protein
MHSSQRTDAVLSANISRRDLLKVAAATVATISTSGLFASTPSARAGEDAVPPELTTERALVLRALLEALAAKPLTPVTESNLDAGLTDIRRVYRTAERDEPRVAINVSLDAVANGDPSDFARLSPEKRLDRLRELGRDTDPVNGVERSYLVGCAVRIAVSACAPVDRWDPDWLVIS